MADDAAIHVTKELSEALEAEAKRAGVSVDALAGEAIARHLEARKTIAHFASLKAGADLDLLDRVLGAQGGEAPAVRRRPYARAGMRRLLGNRVEKTRMKSL